MQTIELLYVVITFIALLCAFLSIGMLFYIGKHHVKEIDRIIFGCETEDDSFFFLMLRVPNYTLGFIWKFYAKRAGLLEMYNHFDKKFKRPFMLNLWLSVIGMGAFLILIYMQKYVLA